MNFNLEELNNSDLNNNIRLTRIIEKLKSGQNNSKVTKISKYQYKIFYPDISRDDLFSKIDERVEILFDEGLVNEVEDLVEMGFRDSRPMQGIGYREVLDFLDGKYSLDETKELVKQSHRQYAKRQITWFEGKSRAYDLIKINKKSILNYISNFQ